MKPIIIYLTFAMLVATLHARVVEYDLTIAETEVSLGGKPRIALTVNGGIPAPVLHFTEGDTARINVHNRLPREETSLHWHGILLPNAQDGVPGITTPCIRPGKTHTFEFKLRHAGTYWYHSHTGLQEQRGVYGAIVVTPRGGEKVRAAADHVLMLSDWTNERPEEVMRTLMRGSDYYSIRKGTKQSILGAAKAGKLPDYFRREWSRVPAMDISDVAYDAFLINGQRRIALASRPGAPVRLRLINAGASSYFYVESATGPLTIIANDGVDVRPIRQKRLLIGNGETYDVLVTPPRDGAWEIRATAQDSSGYASAWIGSGTEHPAPDVPRPEIYSMSVALSGVLDALDETGSPSDTQALAEEKPRPLPPYKRLRALKDTTLPYAKNARTIQLHLNGDMMRYVWSFNGKTMAEDSTIKVSRGEVLRIELINDTMMHHPIHLHGHFFRLLLGQGKYSPLKHTVDVPPMTRRTIEFAANEQGNWLFHCHLLYHMMAGMSRVVSYEGQPPQCPGVECEEALDPFYFMTEGSVQTHMSMGMATLMNQRNNLTLSWDIAWERMCEGGMSEHCRSGPEYEMDLTWARTINPNLSVFAGWRFTNMEDEHNRAIGGITYRLPGLVDSLVQLDSEGDVRVGLSKTFALTERLSAFGRVEYDTGSQWRWSTGATWTLTKQLSLITQYDSDHGFGGGVGFRF